MSSATMVRPLTGGLLWNFALSVILNVYVSPSGDSSHDSARPGTRSARTGLKRGPCARLISRSPTAFGMPSVVLLVDTVGSIEAMSYCHACFMTPPFLGGRSYAGEITKNF